MIHVKVAMTTIEKTLDVSSVKFVCLVKKYVLHKSCKKICEVMKEHYKNSKKSRKVEIYLKNIEERAQEVRLAPNSAVN